MEKTIIIHLNQTVFHIEEEAYGKLQNYLSSIRKHFSKSGDADEIVTDIEASAALHFSEIINAKKQVITLADVNTLIESMGTVDDIAGENEDKNERSEKIDTGVSPTKKLFRDSDNKILGGVASGLAAYFGFDPIVLRLIFVACLILLPHIGGTVFILYLVMWFIIPEAKTNTDKMMMKGEPINLSNLENAISEKAENLSSKSGIAKILRFPLEVIGRTVNVFFGLLAKIIPVVVMVIGLGIIIATALGIAGITSVLVGIFTNPAAFQLASTLPGIIFPLAVAAIFVAAVIPLVFVMLLGVSLMKRKSAFSLMSGLTMLFVWIASLVIITALAVNVLPYYQGQLSAFINNIENHENFDDSTPIDTANVKEINLNSFKNIKVSGIREIKVLNSDKYYAVVTGRNDLAEKTRYQVIGNTLFIDQNDPQRICLTCHTVQRPISVTVYLPQLDSINIIGRINTDLTGINGGKLTVESMGNSDIKLSGFNDELNLKTVGDSLVDASGLQSNSVSIKATGNSSISVNAVSNLNIYSVGNASIKYIGNPAVIQNLIGNTKIEKATVIPKLTVTPTVSSSSAKNLKPAISPLIKQ
jgi:phage shock protein PspC (stress-responsive transcriptional regulator)